MPAASAAAGGAVLIPVKAFAMAKARLSPTLDPADRADVARRMATHVARAQRGVTVAIACDDDEVAAWAESLGALTIWCPEPGLNPAVRHGANELRRMGFASVAVVHGDLPLAADVTPLLGWPGVTIVPDRHRMGTNVLAFAASIDFAFGYGVGSFQRHVVEAVRHRRGLRIVHDHDLGWDIDDPADLDLLRSTTLTDLLDVEGAP